MPIFTKPSPWHSGPKTVLESFHDGCRNGFCKAEAHDRDACCKAFVILEPEHECLNGRKVSDTKSDAHYAAVEQIDQYESKRTCKELDGSARAEHAYRKADGRYER